MVEIKNGCELQATENKIKNIVLHQISVLFKSLPVPV